MAKLKDFKNLLTFKKETILTAAVVFVLLLFLHFIKFNKGYISYISIVLIIVALIAFKKGFQNYSTGFVAGLLLFILTVMSVKIFASFKTVSEWDFMCLFFFGKLGAHGGNFYDPIYSAEVFSKLNIQNYVSPEFTPEIVEVGFWYPLPTMLLLIPLGFLNVETAYISWKIFILLTMVISIGLAIKTTIKQTNQLNLILLFLAIFLIFDATNLTIAYSQTNFLLLIMMALVMNNINNWKSGFFLAIAVIVKPLAIIWAFYFLITKRIKTLLVLVITGISITAISVIIFGFDQLIEYLVSPPTKRLPDHVYNENFNQSLSAILIRFSDSISFLSSDLAKYISYFLSFILLVINVVFCTRLEKFEPKLAFMSFVALSLIIYPASQAYYIVLLLPAYFLFIAHAKNISLLVLSVSAMLVLSFHSPFLVNIITFLLIMVNIKYPYLKNTPYSRKINVFNPNSN